MSVRGNYSQGRFVNDGVNVPVKLGLNEKSAESFEKGCIPANIGRDITVGIRKFVLCKTTADLTMGLMVSGDISAMITSGTNAVKTGTTTAPVGGTIIHLDEASFASIEENQYAGGTISISGGTGIGFTYGIQGNSATFNTDEIYVYIHDCLVLALSTDSDIEITLARETEVAHADSGTSGDFLNIGRPVIAIPAATDISASTISAAGYYFWTQTDGPVLLNPDADNTVGLMLMVDTDVGQVIDLTAGFQSVGTCLLDGASTDTVSELEWLHVQK